MARTPKVAPQEGGALMPVTPPDHPLYLGVVNDRAARVRAQRSNGGLVGRGPKGKGRLQRWQSAGEDERHGLVKQWAKEDGDEVARQRADDADREQRRGAVAQARQMARTAGLSPKDKARFAK